MTMFPHLNYESIISKYRQLREKYYPQRYSIIAAAVFLICIAFGLFLISLGVKDKNIPVKENMYEALIQLPVPSPTEIDSNFLKQVNECFLPVAALYGYTLRISSGFRSIEEQDQIYNQGRTINGHIVTEAVGGRSIHNYGLAVDVVDRWREYDVGWERLGKISEYCGLEPSEEGDISHFEHRNGLATDDFIAGKRPPLLVLPCAIMNERAQAGQLLTLKDLEDCGAPKF